MLALTAVVYWTLVSVLGVISRERSRPAASSSATHLARSANIFASEHSADVRDELAAVEQSCGFIEPGTKRSDRSKGIVDTFVQWIPRCASGFMRARRTA